MMMRSVAYSTFLFAISLVASGCVCVDKLGGRCPDGACGEVDVCSHCDAEICLQCDGIGCSACRGKSPGHFFKGMIHGSGCGQVYWDEWINNPPYCCDPCDNHSQFVGPRCCPPSITDAWKRLWGHRNHEVGYGCGACLDPHPSMHDGEFIDGEFIDGEIMEGEVIYDGPAINAPKPGPASPASLPGKPVSVLKKASSRQPYYRRGN